MICRMCILETPNLLFIFGNEASQGNRAAVITQHFGFEPMENDPITNMICISCWTQIESFHAYYKTVEDAQRQFLKLGIERKIKVDSTEYDEKIDTCHFAEGSYPTDDSWKDNCKSETLECDEDNDGSYECPPKFAGFDQQSDSYDSTDEERKPIARIKEEAWQLKRSKAAVVQTNEEGFDSVTQIKSNGKLTTKSLPKKRGRKKKSEIPIQMNPRTSEYRIKSKQYDEEIAKQTKLKCDLCQEEFTAFNDIQKHYRAEHKIKGYVVCCTTKFYKRGRFLDHIMKHLEPDPLSCDICKKTYSGRRSLRNHMRLYHGPGGHVNTFQCDQCPRKYLQQYALKIHQKKHMVKTASQYNCEECGKGFNTSNALQTHQRYMHENKYAHMCHICAKVLRSRALYLKHQLVEHEGYVEPKQQCKECGAWLKNALRLKLHMKKHMERESEFICTLCGKSSPSSTALQSHIKYMHEAQRQHQCTFCDKAFKKALELKEHLTTHTGDVLYTCPYCPQTFNARANIYSHRKKKHPIEWEEARRIRGAPLKAVCKIKGNDASPTMEDPTLGNSGNSINEESEMDAFHDGKIYC